MTIRKQTAQGVCFMNERQPNSEEHEAWLAANVISEAFFTAMTRNRYEVLAAMDHKRSRYDPVMICMNFKSYASLVIFFTIPVFFFCFVFEHEILYAIRVLTVFDFYYRG